VHHYNSTHYCNMETVFFQYSPSSRPTSYLRYGQVDVTVPSQAKIVKESKCLTVSSNNEKLLYCIVSTFFVFLTVWKNEKYHHHRHHHQSSFYLLRTLACVPMCPWNLYGAKAIIMPHEVGTLAVDGWAVTLGTARRGLRGAAAHPGSSLLYQM